MKRTTLNRTFTGIHKGIAWLAAVTVTDHLDKTILVIEVRSDSEFTEYRTGRPEMLRAVECVVLNGAAAATFGMEWTVVTSTIEAAYAPGTVAYADGWADTAAQYRNTLASIAYIAARVVAHETVENL